MTARVLNWRKSLVMIALVLAVAGAWIVPLAYAKISINTVDPTATVGPYGRYIRVTGPIATDQKQPVILRVAVTQRSTGAVAEGYTALIANATQKQWTAHVFAVGWRSFEPGEATVVALAQSRVPHQGPDDAHQWLVNVQLVEE